MGEPQEKMGAGALLRPPNLGEQNGNKRFREGRGGEVSERGRRGRDWKRREGNSAEGRGREAHSLKAVRGMSDRELGSGSEGPAGRRVSFVPLAIVEHSTCLEEAGGSGAGEVCGGEGGWCV